MTELFSGVQIRWKAFKQTYLFKLVSKFLSVVCSIILVILLIIGAAMFYFNMKIKSYEKQGLEFTAPFGMYTIISGSMEPNIDVYDVVIAVEQDIDKIKIGDVITFISSWDLNYGYTVTHRVVGISKTSTGEVQLTTKGDNNPTSDGGKVTQTNLIGKVVGRIPQLGRLQSFLATKIGWFFVVFIPAAIIIILDVMKIFKLYLLKGQIDNVKSPKDAIKDEKMRELKNKNVTLKELNNKAINKRVQKDENVDTVELPKVGEDGLIKENTSELPTVVDNEYHSGRTEIISIVNADLGTTSSEDSSMPALKKNDVAEKKEEIDIPLLKKDRDIVELNSAPLPKRKELKRRE